MKSTARIGIVIAVVALLAGCAHFPTRNESLSIPATIPPSQVLELVIDAGRQVNFPPATKIDKANGIVEFGTFGMPVIGITAQARVRDDNTLDVTVKRGSVYIPMPVDPDSQRFKDAIEKNFREYKPKK